MAVSGARDGRGCRKRPLREFKSRDRCERGLADLVAAETPFRPSEEWSGRGPKVPTISGSLARERSRSSWAERPGATRGALLDREELADRTTVAATAGDSRVVRQLNRRQVLTVGQGASTFASCAALKAFRRARFVGDEDARVEGAGEDAGSSSDLGRRHVRSFPGRRAGGHRWRWPVPAGRSNTHCPDLLPS